MSRSKLSRHANDDAIRNLQAWQDHQYDPGYRANLGRLGLFSATKRGRSTGRSVASALAGQFILTIAFVVVVSVGIPVRSAGFVFLCATIAMLIVTIGRLMHRPGQRKRGRR